VFAIILVTAGILLALLPLIGSPRSVWWAGIAILPAFMVARRLWVDYDHAQRLIPAQTQMLLAFVLFAAGGGVGLLIAG